MTPERLRRGREAIAERLAGLPRPWVAVLVGGRSKAFDLPAERARALADEIAGAAAAQGGSLLVTFSRRTPAEAKAAMRDRFAATPAWVWDGEGDNPIAGFLGAADHVVVTADSINMVAEAAATGAPVHIAAVEGRQARKDRFHAALAAHGAARPFTGVLERWTYEPLRETQRAAAEVLLRLRAHQGGA